MSSATTQVERTSDSSAVFVNRLAECLDAALRDLRSSDSAVVRAAAVSTLGVAGSPLTTAHLIAALFDPSSEVRRAAAEVLEQIRDPAVSLRSLHAFFGSDLKPAESAEPADCTLDENVTQALVHIDSTLADVPPSTIANLESSDPEKRAAALFDVARSEAKARFRVISKYFGDPSAEVRNAAALALSELEPERTAELFSQALDAAPDHSSNIGDAMVGSGLAAKAIDELSGEDRERGRIALCVLMVMAKLNAVEPLVQAIEEHESVVVRGAAIRILTLNGQAELAEAAVKRRLKI